MSTSATRNASSLIRNAGSVLTDTVPKRIVISGPSGFLGSRVLDCILRVHALRHEAGQKPGEVVLLSSSPGTLMGKLAKKYGTQAMKTVRASRVDYYSQHDANVWKDNFLSLGLEGEDCVFVNLAALAGPKEGIKDAMMDVNYKAPVAAAQAAQELKFGHWVQSSTQATRADRAGQVMYSRAKAMADSALSRMDGLPVSIASLGLLYCKNDGVVGQDGQGLNLIDIAMLPLTPIVGNGTAPLQPQEVTDAAERLAFLAFCDPATRPMDGFATAHSTGKTKASAPSKLRTFTLRHYDAVGPETLSILELLERFASYRRNATGFKPVSVDYHNFEQMLNNASLGNLNRQFISLLRSEQASEQPILGNPRVWARLLGDNARLLTLDQAFAVDAQAAAAGEAGVVKVPPRFPVWSMLQWSLSNPKVIRPGVALLAELVNNYLRDGPMPLPPRRPLVSSIVDPDMGHGAAAGAAAGAGAGAGAGLFHNKVE